MLSSSRYGALVKTCDTKTHTPKYRNVPSAYSADREEIQKYHLSKLAAAVMKRRGGRRLSLTVLRRRYDLHEKLNGNSALF